MPSRSTILKLALTFLAAARVHSSAADPWRRRDDIPTLPHDQVVSMPQLIPEGAEGKLYLTYQPRLNTRHGCVPYPAVDAEGKIGRGLYPSGPAGGKGSKCRSSTGQVYVRSTQVGQYYALLYGWYLPKDQIWADHGGGTRHDWDGVVILLKSRNATDAANIYSVCPSAGDKWGCEQIFSLDGTNPLIDYDLRDINLQNTCYLGEKKGEKQPVVAWESMPKAAAEALSEYDYGTGVSVPFIDDNFIATLALAFPHDENILTLPYESVDAMPQLKPDNMDGTLYLTYQPLLTVSYGCVPFPAVNVEGKIGRGLDPMETPGFEGICDKSVGQVYVRSAPMGKYFSLMYTWYQPKDEVTPYKGWGTVHDWGSVIIHLKSRNATDAANIFAVCPSQAGRWICTTKFILNGTYPLIEYDYDLVFRRNSYYLSKEVGKHYPLVSWESMPHAAKTSLSRYDYDHQRVPFIDANFNYTLERAIPPPEEVPTLGHNRVRPLPQLTPAGMNGTLYLAYQPRLKVLHGCVPFPAVDIDGKIGRGLKPTGPSGGRHSKCDKSEGQVYVRSAVVGNYFALLYTWYQPKDQRGKHGKRDDWEGVLLYLKSKSKTDASNIHAVCPSAGGKWTCSTMFSLDGTFPLIEYTIRGDSSDNTCYLSVQAGEQHPLVAYESMPKVAVDALASYNYGRSKVLFIDEHFNHTLALAIPPA